MNGRDATPDELRAKSMTAEQFIDEVLAKTMDASCVFWLPFSEQQAVSDFVEKLYWLMEPNGDVTLSLKGE